MQIACLAFPCLRHGLPNVKMLNAIFWTPKLSLMWPARWSRRRLNWIQSLSQVYNYVISGWPHVVDPSLVPFKTRQDELSTRHGCLLWGARVIVPPSLQEKVLQELHDTHPGISRMKALARSYVWWPNMDSDIELTVSSCSTCQSMRSDPSPVQIHP